jgi:hypothetical protein
MPAHRNPLRLKCGDFKLVRLRTCFISLLEVVVLRGQKVLPTHHRRVPSKKIFSTLNFRSGIDFLADLVSGYLSLPRGRPTEMMMRLCYFQKFCTARAKFKSRKLPWRVYKSATFTTSPHSLLFSLPCEPPSFPLLALCNSTFAP